MTLTDQQLERYARHIVLPEIGGAGLAGAIPEESGHWVSATSRQFCAQHALLHMHFPVNIADCR